jgi:prepilin-type N-terminal cleavage/methylation domain-containing protein
MKRKGFTLIELLVVIAIIGILASIVLVSLGTARNKARDVVIKANLSNLRAYSELWASGLDGSYDGFCKSADVNRATLGINLNNSIMYCADSADASIQDGHWAACAQLKSDVTKNFCVDYTGNAIEVTGVCGANPTTLCGTAIDL